MATLSQSPILVRDTGLVPTTGTVRSASFNLTGQTTQLGMQLLVTTPGAGFLTSVMVETAVADAADGVAAQWIDCEDSEVVDFDLAAANIIRINVSDVVLDKVRVRMTGDPNVAGAVVSVAFLSTEAIT